MIPTTKEATKTTPKAVNPYDLLKSAKTKISEKSIEELSLEETREDPASFQGLSVDMIYEISLARLFIYDNKVKAQTDPLALQNLGNSLDKIMGTLKSLKTQVDTELLKYKTKYPEVYQSLSTVPLNEFENTFYRNSFSPEEVNKLVHLIENLRKNNFASEKLLAYKKKMPEEKFRELTSIIPSKLKENLGKFTYTPISQYEGFQLFSLLKIKRDYPSHMQKAQTAINQCYDKSKADHNDSAQHDEITLLMTESK